MMDKISHFNSGRANFFLLAVITVVVFAAVLKITASVVLPFTVAVLLACVTYPIVKFLEKFHIPRIVSGLSVLIILFGILYAMGMIIFSSGQTLLTLYPRYEERVGIIYMEIVRIFELPYDDYLSLFENIWAQAGVRTQALNLTLAFTNGFISFLSNAFIVAIFLVFLLMEAVHFGQKLDMAFEGPKARRIKNISSDVLTKVTKYLSVLFFISALNGLLAGIGLWIIGLEFAAVWGVLQFVLNFIPYIGSIFAGIGATIFALIQFWPEPGPIVATALVMLGVNQLCGFILYPKFMGDRLGLSPLMLLVSLMIWGWLWGFAGSILAVPMMAIIMIVCQNIPVLEPISTLMSSRKAVLLMKSKGEADPHVENSTEKPAS